MLTAAKAEKGLTEITLNAETGHCLRLGENGSCQKVFSVLSKNISVLDNLPFRVCKHAYITSTWYIIIHPDPKWTWDEIFVKLSRHHVKFSQPQCYLRSRASSKFRKKRAPCPCGPSYWPRKATTNHEVTWIWSGHRCSCKRDFLSPIEYPISFLPSAPCPPIWFKAKADLVSHWSKFGGVSTIRSHLDMPSVRNIE